MTIRDFQQHTIDDVGTQVTKVFEGLSEEHYDFKLCDAAFTPREIMEHLCECYQAMITESMGGTHEWGSFSLDDKSVANLHTQFATLRGRARQAALDADNPKLGHAYIVAHDAYHVGQMALIRLQTDPTWDPLSIYSH